MADNILRGTIKINAPGVQEEFTKVGQGVSKLGNTLKQEAVKMSSSAAAMGGSIKKGSNEASQALINLSRVAQDAPYGFIGIANNLNPLLESFQRLKATSGTTGGALKALAGELSGAGGIGLALGVASSLLVVFGDKLFGAGKAASDHEQKIESLKKAWSELKAITSSDILGGAGGEFAKAVSAIETLRENVNLAKQGFIDKKEVVAQYNKELGDTIGKVQTLDEVEQKIAQKGEAYLKFTLLKAAAQEALKKASEAALTAAQNEAQANEVSTNAFVQGSKKLLQSLGANTAVDNINKSVQKSTKEFQKTVTDANKQKDRFINIFKEFQDQAAKIAQQNNFNFSPDTKQGTNDSLEKSNEKLKNTLEEKKRILTEFQKDFATIGIFNVPKLSKDLEDFSVEDLTAELREKLQKALLNLPKKLEATPVKVPVPVKPTIVNKANIDEDAAKLAADINKTFNDAIASISVEGLSSIGEAIGAALTGNDIGNVFRAFEQTLGTAVQSLGKQIIALNVAALALKKSLKLTFANPAIGIAAGIALVAVGAAIKNLASGGVKGFNKGGDVQGIGSSDTVPAMLTPGEYVVTKREAPLVKAFLKMKNTSSGIDKLFSGVQKFAFGGEVKPFNFSLPNLTSSRIIQNTAFNFSQQPTTVAMPQGEWILRGKDLVFAISETNKMLGRSY